MGGKSEGGGEGDTHKRGGAGGSDRHGQKARGKSTGPTLIWLFRGEISEKGLKFEDTQKIEGESQKKSEEQPDHRGRLELKTPTEGLARGAKDDEKSGQGK